MVIGINRILETRRYRSDKKSSSQGTTVSFYFWPIYLKNLRKTLQHCYVLQQRPVFRYSPTVATAYNRGIGFQTAAPLAPALCNMFLFIPSLSSCYEKASNKHARVTIKNALMCTGRGAAQVSIALGTCDALQLH